MSNIMINIGEALRKYGRCLSFQAGKLAALPLLLLIMTASALEVCAEDTVNEGKKLNSSKFDNYARAVESLSKNADADSRAVISTMRIQAGTVIEDKSLLLIPLIEYRKTEDLIPEPNLRKRAANEFGSIAEVAGRVALQDIGEQEKVTRAKVGNYPVAQFKIAPDTHVRINYHFRRGAVLPNAAAEIHTCSLDTSSMSPAEASDLRVRLIRSNLLLEPESHFIMAAGGYENYVLEATVGDVTKRIAWSGKSAPDSVRSLVEYLETHSKKETVPHP